MTLSVYLLYLVWELEMKQIESFFSPTVSETLYHYTRIGGLMGIVDSRVIWASHVYYMNDSQEILHACEVLETILLIKEPDAEGAEREFLAQFRDWLGTFRCDAFHLFVFSLSEERSLLSQWRSYTPHGKGVSLGFPPTVLNHVLEKPGFRIAKCLYRNDEHEDLLSSLLKKLLITFRQRLPDLDITRAHPSQKYHGFLESFRGYILQVLAIVKHPTFCEEREWRIISPYFPNYTDAEVKFREGSLMLLPYTELDLPKDGNLFQEVILGPSQDVNLSISSFSTYLSNRRHAIRRSIRKFPCASGKPHNNVFKRRRAKHMCP